MRRRLLKIAIGVLGSAGLLSIVALGAYRAYGPGDPAERLERLQSRWGPFYDPAGAGSALDIWRFVGRGLLLTVEAALISIALSLVFGLLLALMRLARNRQLRFPGGALVRIGVSAPAAVFVQAIRASPLFMLILFTWIAAPRLRLNLQPMTAGIVALTAYTSCVLAEILRAGILSLDQGQFEAADALGLSYPKKLRFVVLPQALRRMVPAVVSQLVTLIKDTSLLSFITVIELTRRLSIISNQYFNPIEALVVAALIYFAINFTLSTFARRLEVRPTRVGRAAEAGVQGLGVEEQAMLVTAGEPTRTPFGRR